MTHHLEKTWVLARGKWRDILPRLGIDPKHLDGKSGPCPICGGKDRFRFDDLHQDGDWFCNQCGAGKGMKLLMEAFKWDFTRAAREIDSIVGKCQVSAPRQERSPESKREYMVKLYKASQPVKEGDPVWLYLTRRCGDVSGLLGDLRFHPELKHSLGSTHPGILAFMGWDGKRFSGIHRTFLTWDGQKADVDPVRASFGELGAVRLGPVMERMGIAEGIETALCASSRFRVPVWSAICANGMEAWEPPEGCRSVLVCGDHDKTFTGQAAAFVLAKKLHLKGYAVEVAIPETKGSDWADFQHERAA